MLNLVVKTNMENPIHLKNKEVFYNYISKKHGNYSLCSYINHQGNRLLPITEFSLKNKKSISNVYVQGYCKSCNKIYNKEWKDMNIGIYPKEYFLNRKGWVLCKDCNCHKKVGKFYTKRYDNTCFISQCKKCSTNHYQKKYSKRDFVYMPDKDNLFYKKEECCSYCGTRKDLTIDHILPISKGGNDFIENKQTLCFSCNRKKSAKIIQVVKKEQLSKRYWCDDLIFHNLSILDKQLKQKVLEYKSKELYYTTPEKIRERVRIYTKLNQLNIPIERIIEDLINYTKE